MEKSNKLKLFISYSHEDNLDKNPYIEQFKKHVAPLKDNGLIEEWYDRKILPGKDYQKDIDNNLGPVTIWCTKNLTETSSNTDECQKSPQVHLPDYH